LRQDTGTDARLVAFFVPRSQAPSNDELRDFAGKTLPQYMVPSAFVPLPDLPVNSSGKIDRRALGSMEIVSERRRVDARDDLESTIAQIWAEVLHVSNVGVTDNFFELGGNSLTAVNLIARITARTGCDLPVTTLFQASTVEQLARRIRDSRNLSSSPGPVVRLQPLGSKPPLIMIPPAGGGLICYSDLARMLAPDQPVLGVEPVRGAESTGSVEALAGRYVRELRSASLNGPLRLAGWSFGGNVAFEMARQLAEQGRAVDLVLLLDSHDGKRSPHYREAVPREHARCAALRAWPLRWSSRFTSSFGRAVAGRLRLVAVLHKT
jgi:acyl carrier protein